MNTQIQHYVDKHIGSFLCFLLTLFNQIGKWLPGRKRTLPPVKRILLVKPVEQGAVVLAYGALLQAVNHVGRENVFFFAFEKNREILDILDVIPKENVITARDDNFAVLTVGMVGALWKMRRLKIDTAVDLEIFARLSIIIGYLSGAKRRIGLHRFNSEGPYRGALVTHRVQYNPYLHTAQAFDVFVRAALVDTEDAPLLKETPQTPPAPPPLFQPSTEDTDYVVSLLQEIFPSWQAGEKLPHPLILFNPKCQDELPERKWADDNFTALGELVLKTWPDAHILVTGLPVEKEACEAMVRSISVEHAHNLAGRLSLRTLITLMTMADLLVSSDSGPAHFAALTDISGVILFGPETPLLYSPLSDKLRVMYLGLACSPCYSPMNYRLSPCTNNLCLKRITPAMVLETIKEVLGAFA